MGRKTSSKTSSKTGRGTIRKPRGGWRVTPNMVDYPRAREEASWEAARRRLDGLPGGRGLNVAHEAVDRHATGVGGAPRGHKVAILWLAKDGTVHHLSYGALRRGSARFAHLLGKLGVEKGDRVFSLTGRIPELYLAALGTLKAGAVFCPLFASFGPEPVRTRLELGGGKVLVTTERLYRRKVAPVRDRLPALEHVLVVEEGGTPSAPPDEVAGTLSLATLLAAADPEFEIPATDPEDPALLHFTSGTTGRPKGAVHVHEAVVAHHDSAAVALDLHPGDVYWCTADPGWVTGTSYGIVAPLTHGVTMLVDEGELDAERWYRNLERHRVSVWYTAPTAIRMLRKLGTEVARRFRYPALRFAASVGEPLDAESVVWGLEAFGAAFHDTWWQTETGAIMIANYAAVDVEPGSMGLPLPGIEAALVRRRGGGVEVLGEPEEGSGEVAGELALRRGWPSMFRGYLGDEERYRRSFADGWYLTGDLARRDADGRYWFVGRADDAIQSAGHLIGPFEVEGALLEHPAVAEAAAIGRPDPVAGEVVKAFVSLKAGHRPSDELRRGILAHARTRLGPAVAPREIEFRPELPKTRSGKTLRRLLRAQELGLPEGDLSTLEEPVPAVAEKGNER